ncbi:Uncharacterised protein r2_g4329 [Pycnogonum litorale]
MWKWRERAEKLKKEKNSLLKEKDNQLKVIQQNLIMFESSLRQEQRRVCKVLLCKEQLIEKQKKEIHMYRSLLINKAKSEKTLPIKNVCISNRRTVSCNGRLSSLQEVESYDENGDLVESSKSSPSKIDSVGVDKSVLTDNNDYTSSNKIHLNHRSVTKPKDVKNKKKQNKFYRSKSEPSEKTEGTSYWSIPFV